jgi:acetyl esterase/lipase
MKKQTWLNCIALACVASLILLCLVGCTRSEQATDTPVPPTPTDTPLPPTATPVPATPTLAARNLTNIDYFDGRRLDVYRPEEASGPFPTVLVLHGYGGTKGELTWLGEALSASGYAAVAPNWSPLGLAAENGLCALAWIHANAETYGFDPERIATFGHSGGGTLAVNVAAIDDPKEFLQECPYELSESGAVRGVITYGGGFVTPEWYLTAGKHYFEYVVELLGIPQDKGEEIRQALLDTPPRGWLEIASSSDEGARLIHLAPPAWIDGSEPPILLIHGAEDTDVDPLESEAFADLLEAAGVEVQVKLVSGAKHRLAPAAAGYDEIWNAIETFLVQVLE